MKKLLFVFDNKHEDLWMDGLYCALKELESDFDITRLNLYKEEYKEGKYDFVLGWGGFNGSVDKLLKSLNVKRGLCIGGNGNMPSDENYDVLFYETDWVRNFLQLDRLHKPKLIKAFGINDAIFTPSLINTPIIWDYLGVGAFASWKRWEKMNEKSGNKLVIGEYQEENEGESWEIVSNLIKNGTMVSNMVHPLDLANIYHWSRTVYIPSNIYGGGERALLEARNCGCKVEIEKDNDKLTELMNCEIPTYKEYAKKIKEGILECLE